MSSFSDAEHDDIFNSNPVRLVAELELVFELAGRSEDSESISTKLDFEAASFHPANRTDFSLHLVEYSRIVFLGKFLVFSVFKFDSRSRARELKSGAVVNAIMGHIFVDFHDIFNTTVTCISFHTLQRKNVNFVVDG